MIRPSLILTALALQSAAPATAQPFWLRLRCATGAHVNLGAVSGVMEPALEPRQSLVARRMADPATIPPGTAIAHAHPVTGKVRLMCLIATVNQNTAMAGGRPVIDGRPILAIPAPDHTEYLPPQGPAKALPRCPAPGTAGNTWTITHHAETLGAPRRDMLDLGPTAQDDTAPVTVPPLPCLRPGRLPRHGNGQPHRAWYRRSGLHPAGPSHKPPRHALIAP